MTASLGRDVTREGREPPRRADIRVLGIVNRGEAAMRCIRAVKALRALEGRTLRAVALYTDADRDAPFVRQADVAFRLPAPRGEVAAYLDHDLLISTLRHAGADAVWPGWGFVAEDPVFADRVAAEGMRFLGPSGEAMRLLGDKIAAKRLAEEVGVPVAPWSGGAVSEEQAAVWAERIGYPLVVKASAGGGGRGIRVVEQASALAEAFRSAAAEARAAFGDERLFLERKVSGGRHIEVQIARDAGGCTMALGCRDCSVQRRHQKLIEEAPPPGLSPALLETLIRAASRLVDRVGYVGVGTVEFLVAGESASFLEVNPRLQVEHGVTEELTGIDLVQLQIRIGRGESIADLRIRELGAAIEARVCAEDPEEGFLPAPGRVARFDAALGPGLRVDSGVSTGNVVPSAFDSLLAKVIATGATREEARARLVAALADLDLVIEGGATNKGYLIELLEASELRAGGVDTGWLDRARPRSTDATGAVESLIAAAILAYQRRRHDARMNCFSDTSWVATERLPRSTGQEVELSYRGAGYRVGVFALGSWRYRIRLDGREASVVLRELDRHVALLSIGEQTLRVLYDASDAGVRIEVAGRAHRFTWRSAGEVCAATPAMVVAVHVMPGESVAAGQPLGLLEAMKMEIAFRAPIAGVVREVRARAGRQVAAGEVLLVIDAGDDASAAAAALPRLTLPPVSDPLLGLLAPSGSELEPIPVASERDGVARMRAALAALREELRAVLLGYDVDSERLTLVLTALTVPLPRPVPRELRDALAALRFELALFADVEQLFVRTPQPGDGNRTGPSPSALLRRYLRRMRAAGAGLPEGFRTSLCRALAHYGLTGLEHDDALERAVLRLLATRRTVEERRRLVLAVLGRIIDLARAGLRLEGDGDLADTLLRLARLREVVGDAIADAAMEASYATFEEPARLRHAKRVGQRIRRSLDAAARARSELPDATLREIAVAPRVVFEEAADLLACGDAHREDLAVGACLYRLYPSAVVGLERVRGAGGARWTVARLDDGRAVLGTAARAAGMLAIGQQSSSSTEVLDSSTRVRHVAARLRRLLRIAAAHVSDGMFPPLAALEILLAKSIPQGSEALAEEIAVSLGTPALPACLTISWIGNGCDQHWTFAPERNRYRFASELHGLHPAAAARVGLARLEAFALERIPAPDGIACFYGRSHAVRGDERIFVLAEVRGLVARRGEEARAQVAAFERAFRDTARVLRGVLAARDPGRRLQWNRISITVLPEISLSQAAIQEVAHRLSPATHRLGIERVLVRLRLADPETPRESAREVELVVTNVTGRHLQIGVRAPRYAPLAPATPLERRIADARRRRLIDPSEILRLLTSGREAADHIEPGRPALPPASFEEYTLAGGRAVPLARENDCRSTKTPSSIVFGVISTPTEKVPEGMRRVLILSDPTVEMGALATPECDRICAAIDLAERLGIPVEWVPISSGARIAMDSGTENLDATARVVRRIVSFTQGSGVIHLVVYGTNVGAQSYWNALATMLLHTRGALVMTGTAAMVLTGRKALEAAGSVAAEDEIGIGGFERIMGANGEAQYFASDLIDAYHVLYEHYRFTYVVPGEASVRRQATSDPASRDVTRARYDEPAHGFRTVGEIFGDATNPGRKRPFAMREVMRAVIDQDGGWLERWRTWAGAETAIVWDAHLGGAAICLIGIESENLAREGYRPLDGPAEWSGGTLFPLSSKKVARALNAASGNRPVVILANLSGFDGSPESMRKLQLEYGAEIARAVVNFSGRILFVVVSRYHGGAYVVFSKALNPGLRVAALEGSYASVIGGSAAAAVVFSREVRARAAARPELQRLKAALDVVPTPEGRRAYDRALEEAIAAEQAAVAAEFDAVHSVERAREVGSLDDIVTPAELRPYLIRALSIAKEAKSRPG